MRRAQALADEHPDWWFSFQYGNPANPKAHYEGTGPEIWRDCPEVTHFVAGLGTAGTIIGVGRFLKERNPAVRSGPSSLRRGRRSRASRAWTRASSRRCSPTTTATRCSTAAASSGPGRASSGPGGWPGRAFSPGISSGAAMAGVARCAAEIDEGTIVTVSPDGGWKYLSTGVWTGDLDDVVERARHELYF